MTIEPSLIVWTVLCFLALVLILKKLLFQPMLTFMDTRNAKIEAARKAKEDARTEYEAEARRLADERVHVDGVDRLGVVVLLHHAADGAKHAVHGLAQVLATVRRDEDEAGALRPLELGVGIAIANGGAKGVDSRVAGDPDLRLRLALVQKVLLAGLSGGEIVLAHDVDRLTVELLRPGAEDVVRAQARLNVAHRDLQVEARERSGEAGRGIAVYEHDIGLLVLEDRLELEQHVARNVEQSLSRLHDGQVVGGFDVEHAKHLVQHLTVLTGDRHNRVELVGARPQLVHERAHLNGLRASAEDEHNFFHISLSKQVDSRREFSQQPSPTCIP